MMIPENKAIHKLQQIFEQPQTILEKEFSPYFYVYYGRYRNPDKFNGYIAQTKHFFEMTRAQNANVLDLGCGFGFMATLLGLFGSREVVGYDLNVEKIDLFKKLLSAVRLENGNVSPVLGDSSTINYPDSYFDVVITNETFSHLREMEKSVEEIHRVLKVGGRFLLRDGNNSLFPLGRILRRKFWKRVEQGPVDPSWYRSTDIPLPYVEIRRKMLRERYQEMDSEKVNLLSKKTAGMFGEEIFDAVREFEETGLISKHPKFSYRNPVTGEYPEKELNPFTLKRILQKAGFGVAMKPYFYSDSFKNMEMSVKHFCFWIEEYLPVIHLFLSPGFTLLGIKQKP